MSPWRRAGRLCLLPSRLAIIAPMSARQDESDGLPPGRRGWAILTVALAIAMAVMDGAIANVALPTIARDVQAEPGELDLGGERLPARGDHSAAAARLAGRDLRLPAHLLHRAGGVHLASLCCALSDSLLTLTLARILQGFGAAGIMSVNGALVRFIYPRRMLGRGIGINAVVGRSISAAIGPTVAAGDPVGRHLAVAVRGQHAARPGRRLDRRRARCRSRRARGTASIRRARC